jgi:hypothetical protein
MSSVAHYCMVMQKTRDLKVVMVKIKEDIIKPKRRSRRDVTETAWRRVGTCFDVLPFNLPNIDE